MLAESREPESYDEDDYTNTDRSFAPAETARERVKLEALQESLESTLRAWDVHVRGCAECLAQGQGLCYEGRYMAEEARETRARIEERLAAPSRPRNPLVGPIRRPLFPGVPA